MSDLTLMFITAGKRPEQWTRFHAEVLKESSQYPIIVKRDEKKMGEEMIYRRMLEAAKEATTPFVATVEDDVLYPPEHFKQFRPPLDTFAYNQHRWALITYQQPMYSWRNRVSNCSLIAPRELLIETLEERFAKYPNGWKYVGEVGRARIDRVNGFTPRKMIEWHSTVAVVQINHNEASEERQRRNWKDHGPVRAHDIPRWRRAEDLITKFN